MREKSVNHPMRSLLGASSEWCGKCGLNKRSCEKNGRDVPIRVITAAAIFDGHDAAIGIFRRIFQSMGCEVIHLGHDRVPRTWPRLPYKKTRISLQSPPTKEVRWKCSHTPRTFSTLPALVMSF